MRPRPSVIALVLLLAACGGRDSGRAAGEDSSAAPASGQPAPATEAEAPPEFADELGIDLQTMQRTPSGLYYEDLAPGRGLAARSGHVVIVHYTAWLPNGDSLDTTYGKEPRSFQLGTRRDVIAGWEEGVTGMRIGGTRRLVIPPHLAWGSRGVPGVIPPSATLVYVFELLEIKM